MSLIFVNLFLLGPTGGELLSELLESVLIFTLDFCFCFLKSLTSGLKMNLQVEDEDRTEPQRSNRESLNSIWSIEHPENFRHEADGCGRQ